MIVGGGHPLSSEARGPLSRWTGSSSGTLAVWLCGLLLWTIMATVSAARPPRYIVPKFVNTPNNVTAVIGSDVILPCSIENLGPKSVIWRKVDKGPPISVADYVFDPDKSYSLTHTDTFTDSRINRVDSHRYGHASHIKVWNLLVTDVTHDHSGTYQCVISTKEDIVRNITLNVVDGSLYPVPPPSHPVLSPEDRNSRLRPKKTGITLTGTHYVEKGSKIDLNCTATAIDYRPKSLDWFKDGSRIKAAGGGRRQITTKEGVGSRHITHSRLTIQRVQMDDAGTYVCRFSQRHVEDIKVIVLNKWPSKLPRPNKLADSSNKRRGTGTDGMETVKPEIFPDDGTVRGQNSKQRSNKDTGCALSSSLLLTLFLVLLAPHLT